MKYFRRWRSRSRAGSQRVQVVHEARRRAVAVRRGHARHVAQAAVPAPACNSAATEASPSPLRTQSIAPSACSSSSAAMKLTLWPPTKTKQPGSTALVAARQVEDLRHVGQVVAGEAHRVRPPAPQRGEEVAVGFHLKVDQLHVMAGLARCGGNQLQAERLQAQVHAGCTSGRLDEPPAASCHASPVRAQPALRRIGLPQSKNACVTRSCGSDHISRDSGGRGRIVWHSGANPPVQGT